MMYFENGIVKVDVLENMLVIHEVQEGTYEEKEVTGVQIVLLYMYILVKYCWVLKGKS